MEAARAGQYGEGFAVVAEEEVRSLAAKSASAAKDTDELIGSFIQKVRVGRELANRTAEMFSQVSDSVCESAQKIATVGNASNELSTAIMQISHGIAQASEAVQTNFATAEECVASREKFFRKHHTLMQMAKNYGSKTLRLHSPHEFSVDWLKLPCKNASRRDKRPRGACFSAFAANRPKSVCPAFSK